MSPTAHLRLGHWHLVCSTYGLAIALGVAIGLLLAVRRARRPETVLVVASITVVGGFLASAAWHTMLHGSRGLSSMGGIAGGLATIAVAARLFRTPARELLDALAPGALAGFAIGRVGCFLAGCCYGSATLASWGVVFPALGPPARHPAQLYEAALDFVVAIGAARPSRVPGAATGRAMVGYGVVRLMLEPFRDPTGIDGLRTGPSAAQWCALGLIVLGLVVPQRRRLAARSDSTAPAR
jgi:phosphatidylglycerol:prolipoprotein diacylglycerol transferase